MYPTGYGSTLSRVSDTAQGYSKGRIPTVGVRCVPIELETAGYLLGGIPYRALLSLGFGADSYAARRLSNP